MISAGFEIDSIVDVCQYEDKKGKKGKGREKRTMSYLCPYLQLGLFALDVRLKSAQPKCSLTLPPNLRVWSLKRVRGFYTVIGPCQVDYSASAA